ncbi:GGDEF domain-containing protein [Kineococcus rhizosphaerae]|uniref:Diguanylate cyclase (GGDEF)-like protein n=1 Tax=Kineococcus rhizosphaerae TaxID=559628 RepID=A0A2T0R2E2_9ACTN|nr:GGDEF domain-containing protein [Kineococcus rhizosphaerae]PRY13978.1 diguanylate cyclase (GGDEF)-like protein [Kineococcus rhizosphaerae]
MRGRSSEAHAPGAAGRLGVDLGVLAAVLVAVAVAQALLGRGSDGALTLFGVTEAVAALVAGACLLVPGRHRRLTGWVRAPWVLLGCACLAWGVGQGLYAVQDCLHLISGATTWADGPFVVFSVLSVASGLLHLWVWGRSHLGIAATLDGLLLGTALLTVVWVGWLAEAVRVAPYPLTDLLVPLVYPVMDVVFLTVTIIQLVRLRVSRVGLLCLAAATAMALSDAVYFYGVVATGSYRTGGLADFGWIAAFGLFAVGARLTPGGHPRLRTPSAGSWAWIVPCAAVVPAAAVGVTRLWVHPDRFVLVAGLVMVVLVVVRQVVALDDHRRLLAVAEHQRGLLDAVAHVDPLTGLENRRRFAERTAEAVRSSLRTGVPLVVAFVDLDRFKLVNDTLGHAAGDDLLRGVAARLRTCVRDDDCAARWGGDEFAVLVTDPGADAHAVADRLGAALLDPLPVAGRPWRATASIGAVREDPRRLLAALPTAATDPVEEVVEALLAAADARMYVVKRAHRESAAADR